MATGTPTPQDLVEHALAASRSHDCVVVLRDGSAANLRWAGNTLTTNGEARRVEATVVAFDHRAGGVATGSVSGPAATRDQVEALVAAADAAASSADPAEDAAPLVGPDGGPVGSAASSWADPPVRTSIGVYDEVAPALGEAFTRAAAAGRLLYGFVDHDVVTTYLGSSTGLRLRHVQPTGHLGCTGKTADLSASAWVGRATADFTDVDPLAVEAELATRLGWAERRVDLPAGRYDVVLPPSAVADLVIDAYWGAGARPALDGRTAYAGAGGTTRVGEQLARPGTHLWSDPAAPGLESSPFTVASRSSDASSVFDNGLALGRTDWLRDGVLTSLLQTRHSAGLSGLATTPYVDNLVLEVDGGAGTTADLVAGTERGLLITCLWYIREVDARTMLLTGLTRDGVYVVEDGEVVGVTTNFRWNESPVDLLRRWTHASATERSFSREWGDDYFNRTATPALRIPDFHMSSVSQAL